ncbi:MAG: hypothetical protein V2A65_04245 [Candidatus Omnitrophota bacterium]
MRKIAVVLVVMVLSLPGLAFGQPSQNSMGGPDEESGMGPGMGGEQGGGQMMAKLQDRMAAMRAYKLVEYLDLTTDEAVKLAPAIKEQENVQKDYREKKDKMLDTLAGLLKKGADPADLKKAMAELQKLGGDLSVATQEQTKKVLALLPVEKQAKYYLFDRYFERQIRQGINKMGGQKGGRKSQTQSENMPPD